MKQHIPLHALAAAVLIVVSVSLGLPISTLFLVGFVLLCPLMMMLMMGGMHGSPVPRTRTRTDMATTEPKTTITHHYPVLIVSGNH